MMMKSKVGEPDTLSHVMPWKKHHRYINMEV